MSIKPYYGPHAGIRDEVRQVCSADDSTVGNVLSMRGR